jgi:hypothetical protein
VEIISPLISFAISNEISVFPTAVGAIITTKGFLADCRKDVKSFVRFMVKM